MPINIYASREAGGDACIIGDRESLIALRNALIKAIDNEHEGLTIDETDGNGHDFRLVICYEDDAEGLEDLRDPYSGPVDTCSAGVDPRTYAPERKKPKGKA